MKAYHMCLVVHYHMQCTTAPSLCIHDIGWATMTCDCGVLQMGWAAKCSKLALQNNSFVGVCAGFADAVVLDGGARADTRKQRRTVVLTDATAAAGLSITSKAPAVRRFRMNRNMASAGHRIRRGPSLESDHVATLKRTVNTDASQCIPEDIIEVSGVSEDGQWLKIGPGTYPYLEGTPNYRPFDVSRAGPHLNTSPLRS